MVFEARLRSHTPISHSEFMPRWASSASSSSGIWSRRWMLRPYCLLRLRQPDVGALGDEHGVGHPGRVGRELFVLVRRIAKCRHLGVADDGGPLLLTVLTPARCRGARSVCGSRFGFWIGRVVHGPDGQLFFVQNLTGQEQKALDAVAQQRLPQFCGSERAGRSARWASQQPACAAGQAGSPALRLRAAPAAGWQNIPAAASSPGGKPSSRPAIFLRTALRTAGMLVAIGRPQHEQFFEGGGAVRGAFGDSGEPLLRRFCTAHHALAGNCSTKVSSSLSNCSGPTCAENQSRALS